MALAEKPVTVGLNRGLRARSTGDREGAYERDLGMSRNAIRSLMLLTPPCLAAWWLAGLTALWTLQTILR